MKHEYSKDLKNLCNSLKIWWTWRDYLSNTVSTSIISWHKDSYRRQSDPIPDILLEGQNQLHRTKTSFWRKTTKESKSKENLKAQVTLICFKSRGKKVWNNPTFGHKCKCVYNTAVSVHLWATGEAWEEAWSQGRKYTPAKLSTWPCDSDRLCTPFQKPTRRWQESQTILTKHVFALQHLPVTPLLKFLQLLSQNSKPSSCHFQLITDNIWTLRPLSLIILLPEIMILQVKQVNTLLHLEINANDYA